MITSAILIAWICLVMAIVFFVPLAVIILRIMHSIFFATPASQINGGTFDQLIVTTLVLVSGFFTTGLVVSSFEHVSQGGDPVGFAISLIVVVLVMTLVGWAWVQHNERHSDEHAIQDEVEAILSGGKGG